MLVDRKINEIALEILRLDEPSIWQLERIIRRAVDYGIGLAKAETDSAQAGDISK